MLDFQINPFQRFNHAAYDVGQRGFDDQGQEYMFCHFVGPCAAPRCVLIDETHGAQRLNGSEAQLGHRCGITTLGDNVGDILTGQFAWVCIYGQGNIAVRGNCQAHAALYSVNAFGDLDDSSAGQTRVHNIYLTTPNSGGSRAFLPGIWYYPII